jgi:hypothetical protein
MPRSIEWAECCHQQAAECASAATTATLSEARKDYLNIEQAWLRLASESDPVMRPEGRTWTALREEYAEERRAAMRIVK